MNQPANAPARVPSPNPAVGYPVRGKAIEDSHPFAEENPDATYKALDEFFTG